MSLYSDKVACTLELLYDVCMQCIYIYIMHTYIIHAGLKLSLSGAFLFVTAGGEFPLVVPVPGDNQTIEIIATDPTDGSRFISTIRIGRAGKSHCVDMQ